MNRQIGPADRDPTEYAHYARAFGVLSRTVRGAPNVEETMTVMGAHESYWYDADTAKEWKIADFLPNEFRAKGRTPDGRSVSLRIRTEGYPMGASLGSDSIGEVEFGILDPLDPHETSQWYIFSRDGTVRDADGRTVLEPDAVDELARQLEEVTFTD